MAAGLSSQRTFDDLSSSTDELEDNYILLMDACSKGELGQVKMLVQTKGVNPENVVVLNRGRKYRFGDSPIRIAEQSGHHDVAKYLRSCILASSPLTMVDRTSPYIYLSKQQEPVEHVKENGVSVPSPGSLTGSGGETSSGVVEKKAKRKKVPLEFFAPRREKEKEKRKRRRAKDGEPQLTGDTDTVSSSSGPVGNRSGRDFSNVDGAIAGMSSASVDDVIGQGPAQDSGGKLRTQTDPNRPEYYSTISKDRCTSLSQMREIIRRHLEADKQVMLFSCQVGDNTRTIADKRSALGKEASVMVYSVCVDAEVDDEFDTDEDMDDMVMSLRGSLSLSLSFDTLDRRKPYDSMKERKVRTRRTISQAHVGTSPTTSTPRSVTVTPRMKLDEDPARVVVIEEQKQQIEELTERLAEAEGEVLNLENQLINTNEDCKAYQKEYRSLQREYERCFADFQSCRNRLAYYNKMLTQLQGEVK
eukprot:CAMPEP_0119152038 /NCGR_PEP_ID=MMETSP1310-20130426/47175_1 /TAXON_ID=464262 /ORGANISM="Genus nov. species nov., Strain RCC2339" /LENGTH=473 /DNA_ID=CAMNT_0007144369 /DNA_START=69 /DNA_END=1487 /DNA_ORIENTATION=-